MFKNGIIIGSFQPFHNGHKALIEYALTQVETVHIFFHDKDEKVGINKFWSTSENLHQIRELFADRLNRFTFNSISKPKYNEKAWIEKLGSIFKVIESPIIFTADVDYSKQEFLIHENRGAKVKDCKVCDMYSNLRLTTTEEIAKGYAEEEF